MVGADAYLPYSRAFTSASLASTLIWASAFAVSSEAEAKADMAFSKFDLAACDQEKILESDHGKDTYGVIKNW